MSRRVTRQTIFLESPTSHFQHLIKNPRCAKRKFEASSLDVIVSHDSAKNGTDDASLIKKIAVDESITSTELSSKPIEEVTPVRGNAISETIFKKPYDIAFVAIESISNSKEPIQTLVTPSHQNAPCSPQHIVSDQSMTIPSKGKSKFSSTPRLPGRRSERLKNTVICGQPTKTASHKIAVPVAVRSVPDVEISDSTDNLPSTSKETIAYKRKAQTGERKKIAEDGIPRLKLNSNNGKIEIIIPCELKAFLIDDSNFIKRQQRCYKIPATQNVAKIIDDYVALKKPTEINGNKNEFSFNQIFDSITEYFDSLLGYQLLYESERKHHLDLLNDFPGENVSKLYTPIYLLRLLIQLNSLIAFSEMENGPLQSTVNYVNEFAKYLADNKSIFGDMNSFN